MIRRIAHQALLAHIGLVESPICKGSIEEKWIGSFHQHEKGFSQAICKECRILYIIAQARCMAGNKVGIIDNMTTISLHPVQSANVA